MDYIVLRNKDPEIYDKWVKAMSVIWFPWEINKELESDQKNLHLIPENHQRILQYILTYFLYFDAILNDYIQSGIENEFSERMVSVWFNSQKAVEDIHNNTYAKLAQVYLKNEEPSEDFRSIRSIKMKYEFVKKYNAKEGIHWKLFVQLIIETIFFQTEFAGIYFLCEQNKTALTALFKANEFISRDEALHGEVLTVLILRLPVRLTELEAHDVIREAISIKSEFIREYMINPIPGFNAELAIQYSQMIADQILKDTGYNPIYYAVNSFPFMNRQKASIRITDFFVTTPTEYNNQTGLIDYGQLFDIK